jgi:hypothetical protein
MSTSDSAAQPTATTRSRPASGRPPTWPLAPAPAPGRLQRAHVGAHRRVAAQRPRAGKGHAHGVISGLDRRPRSMGRAVGCGAGCGRRRRGLLRRPCAGQRRQHLGLGAVHRDLAGVDHHHALHQFQHRRAVRHQHQRAAAAGRFSWRRKATSLCASIELVGSSISRICGSRDQAARQRHQLALAARQQRCRLHPPAGPSPAGGLGPQPVQAGELGHGGQACGVGAGRSSSTLSRSVPLNRRESCGTKPTRARKSAGVDLAQVDAVHVHHAVLGWYRPPACAGWCSCPLPMRPRMATRSPGSKLAASRPCQHLAAPPRRPWPGRQSPRR